MTDFADKLREHLSQSRSAPFLFVGAGMSRRYLELDDWAGLLRRLAELTGKSYDYYFASANGDFPTVATLIAEELHDAWWNEPRFAASRARFDPGDLPSRTSALKAEASIYFSDSLAKLPKSGPLADELNLLADAVVDGVITTNFDPLLEHVFADFRVFVGQEELLFEDPQGVGEIYEIHGSHRQPTSLVLTRNDYDVFARDNPYLAAKLLTIFVEHPIVFLGYSLGDENIASIIGAIVSCLKTKERIDQLSNRLIFVQWDRDVSEPQMASTVVAVDGATIPVMSVVVPDFVDAFTALGQLRRRFPAKLLRRLKEHVYELVLTDDPKGQLHVLSLDDETAGADIEVVFGVGAAAQARGYTAFTRDDLVADVISEGTKLNGSRVVQETLPALLSQPGNVPIFKYLRNARLLDDGGDLVDINNVPRKVADRVAAREKKLAITKSYERAAARAIAEHGTLGALIKACRPDHVLNYLPALDETKLDLTELRRFLVASEPPPKDQYRSQWVKMVCLYDWLRYGRQLPVSKRRRPARRPPRRRPPSRRRGSDDS